MAWIQSADRMEQFAIFWPICQEVSFNAGFDITMKTC
jgi:hypothetical protein